MESRDGGSVEEGRVTEWEPHKGKREKWTEERRKDGWRRKNGKKNCSKKGEGQYERRYTYELYMQKTKAMVTENSKRRSKIPIKSNIKKGSHTTTSSKGHGRGGKICTLKQP